MVELARVEGAISGVFGYFNHLEANTESLIAIMPTLEDERLIEISETAANLGNAAWRIEAAAHCEIIERTESRRGKKGEEGGRNLVIELVAREANCDVTTIRRNAQLFRTFIRDAPERVLNVQRSLKEKGYYEAAMRSPVDPYGYILKFAEIKEARRTFTVREAHKMVLEGTAPGLSEVIQSAGFPPEVESGFLAFKDGCRALAGVVPILRGTLSGYVGDIEHELTRPSQTIRELIMVKITEGCQTVEDFAREFTRPRLHMQILLNRLVEDGLLIEGEENKPEGARGARRVVYKNASEKPARERKAPFEMYIEEEEDEELS